MDTPSTNPFHEAIQRKLARLVRKARTPPPWREAWLRLPPDCTEEDRLELYQAVRDAGSVPADAAFFMIARVVNILAHLFDSDELAEADERVKDLQQEYGLDPDNPGDEDAEPEEYREANRRWEAAWDAQQAATFELFGEWEMARLFREDPDEFDRRYEAGRRYFHGH